MAALPCAPHVNPDPSAPQATPRGISNPYLVTGATFNITCRRGVPGTATDNGRPVENIAIFTDYTFASCMERCATNENCGGVLYGANLTAILTDGDPGGNCMLKSGRWDASVERKEWFASAVKE